MGEEKRKKERKKRKKEREGERGKDGKKERRRDREGWKGKKERENMGGEMRPWDLKCPGWRVPKVLLRVLVWVGFFTSSTHAQPKASTLYLEQADTQFSVSLARNSSDVYMHLSSPACSWIGIGFGAQMRGALMVVVYANEKGDNVTASPRLATAHSEPAYAPDVALDLLPGTGFQNDSFVLNARCRNCRVWSDGFLDAAATAHPMLFAWGPPTRLMSDAADAPLRRHVRYGSFTMDMAAATSDDAGVPAAETASRGAHMMGALVRDRDGKNVAHAVLGCVAVFVLWPLNVAAAAFVRSIRVHVGLGVGVVVLLGVAFALGIAGSAQYIRTSPLSTPHQLTSLAALPPLTLLSLLPHPSLSSLHPLLPALHTPLSALAFLLLLTAGALGLRLSAAPTPLSLAYGAAGLLVGLGLGVVLLCVRRRGSAHARARTRRRLGEDEDGRERWGGGKARMLSWGSRSRSRSSRGSWEGSGSGSSCGNGNGNGGGWHGHGSSSASSSAGGNASAWQWRAGGGGFGGGTMPGPQYLMNMHPGVPVYVK